MFFIDGSLHLKNILVLIIGLIIIIFSIKYNQYSIDTKKSELKTLIKNEYLRQTTNFLINNLKSNYLNISHNVEKGESFNEILKNYEISSLEIEQIKKEIIIYK